MDLPPPQVIRAVVQRYARLLERYSGDIGDRPFVLPTGEYFPDRYKGDETSVEVLTTRMQSHAGMADIPITCRVVSPDGETQNLGNCSSGACSVPQTGSGLARLVDEGESWTLQIPAPELKHPVALTTNLARSLAFIFLVETQKDGETFEPPVEVTADFIAVALGFGALMLQGSYIYTKSCGGPQIARVTSMGVSELAIAVALFAELGGHKASGVAGALGITQREAFKEALRLVRGNKELLQRLSRDPSRVAREDLHLLSPNAVLSGVLRKFRRASERPSSPFDFDEELNLEDVESLLMEMPPSSRAGRKKSVALDPQKEEIKSLVADALSESRL